MRGADGQDALPDYHLHVSLSFAIDRNKNLPALLGNRCLNRWHYAINWGEMTHSALWHCCALKHWPKHICIWANRRRSSTFWHLTCSTRSKKLNEPNFDSRIVCWNNTNLVRFCKVWLQEKAYVPRLIKLHTRQVSPDRCRATSSQKCPAVGFRSLLSKTNAQLIY